MCHFFEHHDRGHGRSLAYNCTVKRIRTQQRFWYSEKWACPCPDSDVAEAEMKLVVRDMRRKRVM